MFPGFGIRRKKKRGEKTRARGRMSWGGGGNKKKLASPFLSDSYFPVRPSKGG